MPKFQKGNPGGPGRPRGSRGAYNRYVERLAGESEETIARAIVEDALDGDPAACRLILRRIWRRPRNRPVPFELPETRTPQELLAAHRALFAAVSDGTLTSEEALGFSKVLGARREAFEAKYRRKRLDRLEAESRSLGRSLEPVAGS